EPGTQQLVVSVYEFAADCGQVTLHVLRMDAKNQKLQDALQVQNFCKLDGSVAGHSLLLDGPYYAKGAALCCPTKNDAHAVVVYSVASRRWSETPPYFTLIPGTTSASPSTETSNASQQQTTMACTVIHSRPGQSFTITLPSNRTTGYEWQLDPHDTAPSIKMLSTRYDAPDSNLVGAPGNEVWTFKTQQSGDLLLGMRYVRPFDKPSVAPAQEAFFVVVVR
ncbi:MAG: protease inhibitor I42 family protein, partial [Candidatus Eremiobacteraeota bacterium]|nr:protease inhibitor I42 family protein [Candidatus Eremiobacteraeota bacterium]